MEICIIVCYPTFLAIRIYYNFHSKISKSLLITDHILTLQHLLTCSFQPQVNESGSTNLERSALYKGCKPWPLRLADDLLCNLFLREVLHDELLRGPVAQAPAAHLAAGRPSFHLGEGQAPVPGVEVTQLAHDGECAAEVLKNKSKT